jgi:hypothetical protein
MGVAKSTPGLWLGGEGEGGRLCWWLVGGLLVALEHYWSLPLPSAISYRTDLVLVNSFAVSMEEGSKGGRAGFKDRDRASRIEIALVLSSTR